eukprot:TRINITY_DN13487_c0_g1_i1.p1 TRINITY_DN13487_c0_g1~~TRINITY_DN13487_c0_g1_i1.p1  ORF type:complete len:702 (+),score=169.41 TRINITY_DN13487_c0_g1_i1:144-2249(+)
MAYNYPEARLDDTVDDYHGVKVPDRFRYLEEPGSEETVAWAEKQNVITDKFLNAIPYRETYRQKLMDVYNYEKFSCPFKRGSRYFYSRNSGLQNQYVTYTQDALDAPARELLDPNKLSDDGTVSLAFRAFTQSGDLMAYGLSKSGSDWVTIHVMDVATGKTLEDKVEWVKFSGASWTHDDAGFFYSRYPTPKSLDGSADEAARGSETDALSFHKLFYHKLGTAQSDDVLVYETSDQPRWMFHGEVSDDGKTLLLSISESTAPVNRLYYAPINGSNKYDFVKLVDNFDAAYAYITNDDNVFYFRTNLKAPKYRLIKIDVSNPSEVIEVIPQSDDVLQSVDSANLNQFVVCYLHDVKDVLFLYDMSGKRLRELPLPGPGSVGAVNTRRKDTEMFYSFESFTYPGDQFHFDFVKDELKTFRSVKIPGFNAEDFVTEQVFYESLDGTRVPMFLVYKKGTPRDGNNMTVLYGYGGFSISISPYFSVFRVTQMAHFGNVLAIANIRGGGEYGEDWHEAGILGRKQNVFDDFAAAAMYLTREKYTRPEKIAILGGSNGGLLVAASVTQRPELFGCGVAQVPVCDMLRFHKFTIGKAWCADYGCSDNKEDFEYQIKYSPIHNVRPGKPLPAVLVCTADHDDRVVPLHSYKFTAELQHVLGKDPRQVQPLMIRIEMKAGHGAGKPTAKVIAEVADVHCFMATTTGTAWRE